jgi:hypothetical protein
MVNRNSPSKFKSNEVDAAMPVSSEGLRTTDEAGIGQRIRRTADNDETLTKNLFPGQFIHGIFSYWPELLVILLVKFLLCYFGILTGLIERCSYFARDLCPKYWPELLVTPLVIFLPTTIDPTSGSRFTNKWKEVSNEFELVFAGDAEPECSLSITSRRLISNQKEYPSTYIAISGIPNFFDRDLSPNLFIDRSAYLSHVLESYFYPEITENGTLPSLGIIRMTCVGNIPIFYDPFELLGSDWAFSLLQDLNFCLLTSSLRYLEPQKNINFSKEALGIPSSWHSACIACFMPDAGNTPLLEGCLELFESQKNFVQIFYGPLLLSTQERQHDNPSLEDSHASQSHVLEPYSHPEITEVGTLPSLGAMRATCVANILMNHHGTHYYVDVKAGACILSTHDEVRWKEPRDNNIFYQEGLPYLIPAVGSSRALEGALEACDTTYGHLPAHYYQPRTPMILCNYYRAWILGISIMALIFATFSPKGTQDIKLIANINEPFPTGAKQRDQTDCGNLPSHYIEISRRKKQSTQVSMIQRWVGGSFLEARHSSVDYDFGSDLYTDSGLKLNSGSGILHSTPPSATQERQHDNPSLEDSHASQSHVLEPYFHPEITEVGTLPSLGAVRVTCVGKIQIADGVGQKRRDFEEMTWAVFLQGHRRDFTAASVRIAAEYLIRALIIHSRKPASEERWKRHHLLRRSPHLLVEVTLVSRQKDLLVV